MNSNQILLIPFDTLICHFLYLCLFPSHDVIATLSGKQTHLDNADSGVQFITLVGPRQSLILAKDPDQHL